MKNKICILTVLVGMLFFSVSYARAESLPCQFARKYGETSIKEDKVDTTLIKYYCEFTNKEKALENFKNENTDALEIIKNKYNLEKLNLLNWKDYYEILKNNYINVIDNNDISNFLAFFDIFENDEQNIQLKNTINLYKQSNTEEIKFLLESLLTNEDKATEYSTTRASSYNRTNAVAYAEKYAWGYNTNSYIQLSNDNTNFASQVATAGGCKHVHGDNGWYYDAYFKKYSRSWSIPHFFVKYFGKKQTYSTITSLSKNVTPGDIIAEDYSGDGDYDRLGTVTYTSNTEINTTISSNGISSPVSYNNFIISQHSPNYNQWVSEDANNWEYGMLTNARYAIINVNK